jgi:hypothetical protein
VSAAPSNADEPHDREIPRAEPVPAEREEEEADERFWQWLALVVLLACWLAEASMCGNG